MNSLGGLQGDLDGPIMSSFGVLEVNARTKEKANVEV
jgi:hypothetical protein